MLESKETVSIAIKTCPGSFCKAECSEKSDVSSNYLFITREGGKKIQNQTKKPTS